MRNGTLVEVILLSSTSKRFLYSTLELTPLWKLACITLSIADDSSLQVSAIEKKRYAYERTPQSLCASGMFASSVSDGACSIRTVTRFRDLVGTFTGPSGAVVPNAPVTLTSNGVMLLASVCRKPRRLAVRVG
jgi:hypothetical protein